MSQRDAPTLEKLAVLVDAGQYLDDEIRLQGRRLLIGRLRQIRNDAEKGRFAGGGVDSGALAWRLATAGGGAELWDELSAVFCSPAVRTDDKDGIARSLAYAPQELPKRYRSAFIEAALREESDPELSAPLMRLRSAPGSISLIVLVALDAIEQPEVTLRLAEMAGEGGRAGREEVSRVISILSKKLEPNILAGTVLQLNRDDSVGVRSNAARATASLLSFHPRNPTLLQESFRLLRQDGISVVNQWFHGVIAGAGIFSQD